MNLLMNSKGTSQSLLVASFEPRRGGRLIATLRTTETTRREAGSPSALLLLLRMLQLLLRMLQLLLHVAPITAVTNQFLAATSIQLHPSVSQQPIWDYSWTNNELQTDVDVVSIHEDAAYGVPWEHFFSANDTVPPPTSWSTHIVTMQAALSGGVWQTAHGSFLTLSLVNNGLGRTCPAGNATESGGTQTFVGPLTGPCSGCYDFNPATNPEAQLVRDAHLKYVDTMVRAIRPRFLCHAPEVNMYASRCSATQWQAVVSFANDVYKVAKAANTSVTVFPSFQAGFLRGEADASDPCRGKSVLPCVTAAKLQIEPLSRDLFALSAYPSFNGPPLAGSYANGMGNFSLGGQLAFSFEGYLEGILSELPRVGERLAIAETGAIATNVTVQLDQGNNHECVNFLRSDPQRAAVWLQYLADLPANMKEASFGLGSVGSSGGGWELLTWWSDADWLPASVQTECYKDECSFPHGKAPYCQILTEFRELYKAQAGEQAQWQGEMSLKTFGTMGLREFDLTPRAELFEVWRQMRVAAAT
jgi:hypothetical protein